MSRPKRLIVEFTSLLSALAHSLHLWVMATRPSPSLSAPRSTMSCAPRHCPNSLVSALRCHGIPDSRKLEDGDIVNVDVTVYLDGFHGDCSATFLVGKCVSFGPFRLLPLIVFSGSTRKRRNSLRPPGSASNVPSRSAGQESPSIVLAPPSSPLPFHTALLTLQAVSPTTRLQCRAGFHWTRDWPRVPHCTLHLPFRQ